MSTVALSNLMLNPNGLAFDPEAGNTYTLNDTGLAVLRAFQAGHAPAEIVEQLVETYEVARGDAERDLGDFLSRLRSLGLL